MDYQDPNANLVSDDDDDGTQDASGGAVEKTGEGEEAPMARSLETPAVKDPEAEITDGESDDETGENKPGDDEPPVDTE
ncbi:MAG: hypothetical protein ABSE91_00515 [Patescibacteria group bacterium]